MRTVNRIELFAKPEVKGVLEELRNVARRTLPDGDFAQREAVMLAIFDEAGRGLLEEELQAIADRYHLLERLADALEIVESDAAERSRLLNHWNERLDMQDSAIDSVERYLEARYLALPVEKQKQLWEHLVYLNNNKDRLRYVTLATSGLPIVMTDGHASSIARRAPLREASIPLRLRSELPQGYGPPNLNTYGPEGTNTATLALGLTPPPVANDRQDSHVELAEGPIESHGCSDCVPRNLPGIGLTRAVCEAAVAVVNEHGKTDA